jgi:hypothetical protein
VSRPRRTGRHWPRDDGVLSASVPDCRARGTEPEAFTFETSSTPSSQTAQSFPCNVRVGTPPAIE